MAPKITAEERKKFKVTTADKLKAALGITDLIASGKKFIRDARPEGSMRVDAAIREANGGDSEAERVRRLRAEQDKAAGITTN